jgi:acyl-CoA synthetase (AMP-forming)/AMP-acid ligase II
MYARGEGDRPPPGTLNHLFFTASRKWNKPDAMQVRVDGSGSRSHATIVERVRRIALGLGTIGVTRGDRVAILSENRPEWALADYACLTAGLRTCRSTERCPPSRSRICSRTVAPSRSLFQHGTSGKDREHPRRLPATASRHRVR